MKKLIQINGQLIEARKFATKKAADNYMTKKQNRKLLYFSSHTYIVSI